MLKFLFPYLLSPCILGTMRPQAQQRSTTPIQPVLDESILIYTDKPVYFPDDTHHLAIRREDSIASVISMVAIEGMKLKFTVHDTCPAVIPRTVTPGSCFILLKIVDVNGLWSLQWCCGG